MNTSMSTPANSTANRRFGFWGNLLLSRKLLLAFGALFVFALVIAAVTLWGLNRVTTTYETVISQDIEVRRLSAQLSNDLLTARRNEKNFLLRWKSEGFETANTNYLIPLKSSVTAMRTDIKQLEVLSPAVGSSNISGVTQASYEADLATLTKNIDTYEQSFNAEVSALLEKGANANTGMELTLRDTAHTIETLVSNKPGLEPLAIAYLEIRRNEKDYLARGEQTYIDAVYAFVSQLKSATSASELLDPAQKTELTNLADEYKRNFDAIVAQNKLINDSDTAAINASRAVEPIVAKIADLGVQLAAEDTNTAHTNSTQTYTLSIATVVVVLAISIFLAIFLSRQLTNPVVQLTNTAEKIAGGNFDVTAEVASGDEIGTLAQTFNTMTARLQVAFENVRLRSLAVQTSAEVSRRLSVATNPRQLAVDVVEQVQAAFHYYHAHIYFVDETTGDLVMAGGTGEAGATMLARGHKIPKGRGLVGRAADTNTAVLVQDTSKAEGWLPNPLLPDTKSETAIPISTGRTVLGVLDVQQNVVNGLSDQDVELLQALAGQVAISYQNARNFEESRAKADLETMVNTIGQKIQRAGSMEETLQTAIRELGVALGATRVQANIGKNNNN